MSSAVSRAPGRARAAGRLRRRYYWSASQAWTESFLLRLSRSVKRDAVFLPDAPGIAAGGEAINLGSARADVAHALAGEGVERIDVDAFARQEIAFHLRAVRVLADAAARRNDAMARHDERHDVLGAIAGYGANGARVAGLLRHPGVGPYFADRNAAQRMLHGDLEVRRVADIDVRFADAASGQRGDHVALQRRSTPHS